MISRSSRPDLFDLVPRYAHLDGHAIVAWHDLERHRGALRQDSLASGMPVRALGYMMEGDRTVADGRPVDRFVLLPDAGNALHSAHRFGDQMIGVRLRAGSPVRFVRGSLVWAWGTLRGLSGDPNGAEPLYVLDDARCEPADRAEIAKYFR